MIQTAILILSGLAFWLSTNARPGRAGYAIGLLAQPLWIWETWHAAQWGMSALSLCFFIGYARGLWRYNKQRRVEVANWRAAHERVIDYLARNDDIEPNSDQPTPAPFATSGHATQYLPNGQRREWPIADSSDRMLNDIINRRVKIEQALFDCANGKAPMPDKELLRRWALDLGTPTNHASEASNGIR